jgi:hypothetical protein
LSTGTANGAGGSWLTQPYTSNDAILTTYNYGTYAGWISGSQQVSSPQANISLQMNAAYNSNVNPSQQPTHGHPYVNETPAYHSQHSQPQEAPYYHPYYYQQPPDDDLNDYEEQ